MGELSQSDIQDETTKVDRQILKFKDLIKPCFMENDTRKPFISNNTSSFQQNFTNISEEVNDQQSVMGI